MSKFNIEEIKALADKNLASVILHRNKLAHHGKRVVTDNYMIYTLGIANADGHLNGVICLGSEKQDGLLEEAIDFFKYEKRDFIIWIRDHKDLGFEQSITSKGYTSMRNPGIAGMMINNRIEEIPVPSGYTLKKVESLNGVSDYAKVTKDAFNKEDDVLSVMYGDIGILIGDNISAFVLYKGREAVAACTTILSNAVAGIYYLATIEGHRGHGIGSYMTTIATNAGFDMGADTVILQASILGEPIYKKLGYEVITHYRWYKIEV